MIRESLRTQWVLRAVPSQGRRKGRGDQWVLRAVALPRQEERETPTPN